MQFSAFSLLLGGMAVIGLFVGQIALLGNLFDR